MTRLHRPRLPRVAWLCAAVAVLNGLVWSVVTPPFQVPDEISHFAYVQYLAETGDAPRHVAGSYMSEEQTVALERIGFFRTVGQPLNRPAWTEAEAEDLDAALAQAPDRVSDGSSSTAVNNPPFYYALQVVPYTLASGESILDRLAAMRLLSILLTALTVVAVLMFLRETFPATPWAGPAGALVVAFQPLFGFISSGVNNDSALYLMSALLFWMLARALRRGLSVRRAAAIGIVAGLGVVTKLTFVAFLPAIATALLLLVWRDRAAGVRRSVAAVGVAAVAVAAPFAVYLALNEVWGRELFGALAGGEAVTAPFDRTASLMEQLSYTLQLYAPRLPFQTDLIPGFPLQHLWLNGLIGRFGWLDYGFSPWVYDLGLGVAVAIVGLAIVGLVTRFATARDRWREVVVYGLAALVLMAVVAQFGYSAYLSAPYPFEQARYLLPLAPLLGALVVLAAKGTGQRLAPITAGVLVGVFAAHGVFSQLLTLSRYYG